MFGNNASKVRFNCEGIQRNVYSYYLFENWEKDMKGAIGKDLIDEGYKVSEMKLEECYRYAVACERVIVDLIFWCKWHELPGR